MSRHLPATEVLVRDASVVNVLQSTRVEVMSACCRNQSSPSRLQAEKQGRIEPPIEFTRYQ